MVLSIVCVLVLCAYLFEWYWTRSQIGTTGVAGDPVYQLAPVSSASNRLNSLNRGESLFPTCEAVPGAILAIAVFALFTRLAGPQHGESHVAGVAMCCAA